MKPYSRSVSAGVSTEVGSSRMTTRALRLSTLASSTSCRSPTARSRTGRAGSRLGASRLSQPSAAVTRALPRRCSQGACGNAASRFSSTDSAGTSENCWNTMPMPRAIASRGDAKVDRPAVDADFARVGVIKAIEHFHQCAFAGAVFAEQRQHFAGADFEIDVVVGDHGAELLANAGHGDERLGRHPPSPKREDAVDFDRGAARQIGDADGGAGMAAVVAEQFVDQIRCAIDDLRNLVECAGCN